MDYEEAMNKALTFEDEAVESTEEATDVTDVEEQESKESGEKPEEEATTEDEGDAEESNSSTDADVESEIDTNEQGEEDSKDDKSSDNWYKSLPKEAKRALRKKDRELKRLKKQYDEFQQQLQTQAPVKETDPTQAREEQLREHEYKVKVDEFIGNVSKSLDQQFATLEQSKQDLYFEKVASFEEDTGLTEKYHTLATLAKSRYGMEALVSLMSDDRQVDILADMDDKASAQYVGAILREIEYSGGVGARGMTPNTATKTVSSPKVKDTLLTKKRVKNVDVTPNSSSKSTMNKGGKKMQDWTKDDWAKEFGYK